MVPDYNIDILRKLKSTTDVKIVSRAYTYTLVAQNAPKHIGISVLKLRFYQYNIVLKAKTSVAILQSFFF